MDTSGLVEQVAQVLQQHPDQLRIKKLAFGVCEKRWENDPVVLNRRDFISLINRLLAAYRCIDDLRQAVLKVVARLNRQTRYLPLAYFLLDQVEPLYVRAATADDEAGITQFGEFSAEEPTHLDAAPVPAGAPAAGRMGVDNEETAFASSAPAGSGSSEQTVGWGGAAIATHPASPAELTVNVQPSPATASAPRQAAFNGMTEASLSPYAAIARNLERHAEAHRIHKLIYGVCHQTWENDMLRLQSHPLLDLLELLHHKAPSLAHLAVMLNQKAATLNRKLVYMQIAHVICELMRPVYNGQPSAAAVSPGQAAIATPPSPDSSPATAAISADMTSDMTAPISPITDSISPADNGWDAIVEGVTQAEWEPAMNSLNQHPEMTIPEIHSELLAEGLQEQPLLGYATGVDDEQTQPFRDRSDLFELRLQIIRYANPLRAKLILFSSLQHTFDFSSQDWLLLKDVTLEDLLRQLFRTYHSMDEVDVNLTRAAYALPNIYQQDATVTSLMRAIAPYYPADSSVNVA
ncbi:MAG: hypothetical protein ACTS2F_16530 [Thainema sp.]